MGNVCVDCGEEYERIGNHWRYNPDHRPSFSSKQQQIITGVLMGDGWIGGDRKNSQMVVTSISKNYLQYLQDVFGVFSKDVRVQHTAEENAIYHGGDANNYNDTYIWSTSSHPELSRWLEWYTDSGKVWPVDISLTPIVLKHWYVGDGHFNKTNQIIEMTVTNERGNKEKVQNYFNKTGLPSGSWYESSNRKETRLYFSKKDSEKLLEYMGGPLPDFEYKWPKDLR